MASRNTPAPTGASRERYTDKQVRYVMLNRATRLSDQLLLLRAVILCIDVSGAESVFLMSHHQAGYGHRRYLRNDLATT